MQSRTVDLYLEILVRNILADESGQSSQLDLDLDLDLDPLQLDVGSSS